MGKTDLEINTITKFMFALLAIITFTILIISDKFDSSSWVVFTIRVFLLLNSIIPISLKVNLDFAKLIYAQTISRDKQLPGTICRNSNIPEELGRV